MILEAADSVGSAWRHRWDSLVSSHPAVTTGCRDSRSPATRTGIRPVTRSRPTSSDTRRVGLPVELSSARRRSFKNKDADGFVLDARRQRDSRRRGRRCNRALPDADRAAPSPRGLAADVFQTHSVAYRRPADLPEGRVLVVGGGSAGFQIAKEVAGDREVHLAIGSRQTPLPQRLLGRDIFWWLTKLGLLSRRRLAARPACCAVVTR